VLELAQEPLVDVGQLVDLVDGAAVVERVGDGEQAAVGRLGELLVDLVVRVAVLRTRARTYQSRCMRRWEEVEKSEREESAPC